LSEEAYDRGVTAGQIDQRLKEHDQHLNRINGSMEKVATNLGELTMQIQRLADAAEADRRTVVVTAAALKEATEKTWSPLARWGVAAGIIAAVGTVLAIVLANLVH